MSIDTTTTNVSQNTVAIHIWRQRGRHRDLAVSLTVTTDCPVVEVLDIFIDVDAIELLYSDKELEEDHCKNFQQLLRDIAEKLEEAARKRDNMFACLVSARSDGKTIKSTKISDLEAGKEQRLVAVQQLLLQDPYKVRRNIDELIQWTYQ